MKIIVLVKEVPDMERVQFDSERGVINRASAEAEINPFDRNALQAAVDLARRLRGEGEDCTVTALTMGPPGAERTLRDVYARGADDCVLLTDRKFGGADTLATAHALAGAIQALGGFDLIVCGEKTVDGDTAQVGPEVAELLDIPHCCYVEEFFVADGAVEATARDICGRDQVRRMVCPALLSVTKNAAVPALPTLRRKLESLTADIRRMTHRNIAPWAEETQVGMKGSPTRVAGIRIPGAEEKESAVLQSYGGFAPLLHDIVQEFI